MSIQIHIKYSHDFVDEFRNKNTTFTIIHQKQSFPNITKLRAEHKIQRMI